MELCDLLYIELTRGLRNMVIDGKEVEVDYIYNRRVVDADVSHFVLLYQIYESSEWMDLGAYSWYKVERVSIDVRTMSKDAYGVLKSKIFDMFNGRNYVFEPKESFDATIEEGISATSIEDVGVYTKKIVVVDPSMYNVGDYVRVIDATGEEYKGWIADIYGNKLLVFTRAGEYFLIRPSAVSDLSDKMKQLYRCVIEVEGRAIIGREV